MRTKVPDILEKGRVKRREVWYPGEWYGWFVIKGPTGSYLNLIVSAGDPEHWPFGGVPWDHVSVSVTDEDRCPTWEEMNWIKDLCFDPEECVIQFHPPKSEYVNIHKYVLHLWRPVGVELPRPPKECV